MPPLIFRLAQLHFLRVLVYIGFLELSLNLLGFLLLQILRLIFLLSIKTAFILIKSILPLDLTGTESRIWTTKGLAPSLSLIMSTHLKSRLQFYQAYLQSKYEELYIYPLVSILFQIEVQLQRRHQKQRPRHQELLKIFLLQL